MAAQQHSKAGKHPNDSTAEMTIMMLPSEPSNINQVESSIIEHNLYWLGSNWACHNCKLKGDKFTMQNIACNGNKKK
jgi:hypothetical protein